MNWWKHSLHLIKQCNTCFRQTSLIVAIAVEIAIAIAVAVVTAVTFAIAIAVASTVGFAFTNISYNPIAEFIAPRPTPILFALNHRAYKTTTNAIFNLIFAEGARKGQWRCVGPLPTSLRDARPPPGCIVVGLEEGVGREGVWLEREGRVVRVGGNGS